MVPRGRQVQRPAARGPDRGGGARRPDAAAGRARRAIATSTTPDTAEVPETAAVNIRNRCYTIAVEVDVDSEDAGGVLFSHGARFGGHALYVKDGKLKYAYNFVGDQRADRRVDRRDPARPASSLGASFEREGDAMPATARSRSSSTTRRSARGRIMTQPGNFSLVGEGLNVGGPGRAGDVGLSRDESIRFTGGTIKRGDHRRLRRPIRRPRDGGARDDEARVIVAIGPGSPAMLMLA